MEDKQTNQEAPKVKSPAERAAAVKAQKEATKAADEKRKRAMADLAQKQAADAMLTDKDEKGIPAPDVAIKAAMAEAATLAAKSFEPTDGMTVEALVNAKVEQLVDAHFSDHAPEAMFTATCPSLTVSVDKGDTTQNYMGVTVPVKAFAQFKNGTFLTKDEELAQALRDGVGFGKTYREVESMEKVRVRRACEQVLISQALSTGATTTEDENMERSRRLQAEVKRMVDAAHVQ